jgi:hypothetical protein
MSEEGSSSSTSSKKPRFSRKAVHNAEEGMFDDPNGTKRKIRNDYMKILPSITSKAAKTRKKTKQITQNMLNYINEEKDLTAKEQIHHIREYVESLGLSRSEEQTRLKQIFNGFFRALAERAKPEDREFLISKYRFYMKPTSFRKLFETMNGREQSYKNRGKKIRRSLTAFRIYEQAQKYNPNSAYKMYKKTKKTMKNFRKLSPIKEEN